MSEERENKKAQFETGRSNGSRWLIAVSLVICLLAAGAWLFSRPQGAVASPAAAVQVVDGAVQIPLATVSDGQAHFFKHQTSAGSIGFFLIRGADGALHAAFDACDVCYKAHKGYRQQGAQMICNNCDQAFPVEKVGVISGGCNPAPLTARIVTNQVLIAVADLERGAGYFR